MKIKRILKKIAKILTKAANKKDKHLNYNYKMNSKKLLILIIMKINRHYIMKMIKMIMKISSMIDNIYI